MKLTLKDATGFDIKVGSIIAYPTRRGNVMSTKTGTVKKINSSFTANGAVQITAVVERDDGRLVKFKSFGRSVVLG